MAITALSASDYITDVLVNGTQEATFSQSEDSSYDISVSSGYNFNGSTYSGNVNGSLSGGDGSTNARLQNFLTTITVDISWTISAPPFTSISIKVNGNTLGTANDGETVSGSGTYTTSSIDATFGDTTDNSPSYDVDITVSESLDNITTFYSIDNISKN